MKIIQKKKNRGDVLFQKVIQVLYILILKGLNRGHFKVEVCTVFNTVLIKIVSPCSLFMVMLVEN